MDRKTKVSGSSPGAALSRATSAENTALAPSAYPLFPDEPVGLSATWPTWAQPVRRRLALGSVQAVDEASPASTPAPLWSILFRHSRCGPLGLK